MDSNKEQDSSQTPELKSRHKKPKDKKAEQLKLHVEGGQGFQITTILAKQSTKVYKLLDAYCKEHNIDPKEYRLIFKDKILHLDKRLEEYNFPPEATINVFASQTGGGFAIL
ncbi:Small ubiquitin- modifier 2 [Glugoides intestinalis]